MRDWTAQVPGLELTLAREHGYVVLSLIRLPRDLRQHGIGEQIMRDLCERADLHADLLAGTPNDEFGASVPRLVRWYQRHGFQRNRGRSRDHTVFESMVRQPRRSSAVV